MFKIRLIPVVRPTADFVPSPHAANADYVRLEKRTATVATTMENSRSPIWASASSRRIRLVEGAVILALMGYFATGLGAAVGIF